jgi:hypothetical protein
MRTLENLFPVLMLIGLVSPLIALVSAILFYVHHRDCVEPERHIPVTAFILALIVCAAIAGCFGLYLGLNLACNSPTSSNLCGLWAFLVTGPILMALGIFLVGLAVSLVQPRPRSWSLCLIQKSPLPDLYEPSDGLASVAHVGSQDADVFVSSARTDAPNSHRSAVSTGMS